MSSRAVKWTVALLSCAAIFAGWEATVLSLQIRAANAISSECANLERSALSSSDPQALELQIQWLQVYYRLNSGRISRSSLRSMVRRDYEHTVTNAFSALKRMRTNELANASSEKNAH